MECISQETVDRTWQAVAAMAPEQAAEAIYDFSEAQPHLLGFVMDLAEDLNQDDSELCTYMLYVVYQMFVNSASKSIPTVTESQMRAQYDATCELVDSLDESAEKDDTAIELEIQNQPHVYQYVTDTLLDGEEDGDQVEVSEEAFNEIFFMMKTVIDVVDSVTN